MEQEDGLHRRDFLIFLPFARAMPLQAWVPTPWSYLAGDRDPVPTLRGMSSYGQGIGWGTTGTLVWASYGCLSGI